MHRAAIDREQGFTLLEILVVLVITGILASLALLSFTPPSEEQRLEQDAQRLAILLDYQCREAGLTARTLGARLDPEGYRFLQWRGQEWQAVDAAGTPLRQQQWQDDWRMDLDDGQGRRLALDDAREQPQLVCLAGGEQLPFRLTLASRNPGINLQRQLLGLADGRVLVQ